MWWGDKITSLDMVTGIFMYVFRSNDTTKLRYRSKYLLKLNVYMRVFQLKIFIWAKEKKNLHYTIKLVVIHRATKKISFTKIENFVQLQCSSLKVFAIEDRIWNVRKFNLPNWSTDFFEFRSHFFPSLRTRIPLEFTFYRILYICTFFLKPREQWVENNLNMTQWFFRSIIRNRWSQFSSTWYWI